MNAVWHDLLTGILIFSFVPAALALLAWRDQKTAAAESDPIGTIGTSILILQTVASVVLPALVYSLWRGVQPKSDSAQDIAAIGFLFWLASIPATAIWAGKARRFLISACVISMIIYGFGLAGA
jgi:hypothetical protein